MAKLIIILFEKVFSHIAQFFEHIHWPEALVPRAIGQLAMRTYHDFEIFWDTLGIVLLVMVAGGIVILMIKKKPTN